MIIQFSYFFRPSLLCFLTAQKRIFSASSQSTRESSLKVDDDKKQKENKKKERSLLFSSSSHNLHLDPKLLFYFFLLSVSSFAFPSLLVSVITIRKLLSLLFSLSFFPLRKETRFSFIELCPHERCSHLPGHQKSTVFPFSHLRESFFNSL